MQANTRRTVKVRNASLLLAAATMLPLGMIASPAGAAVKNTCKTATGTANFSPALPKLKSPAKVKPTIRIVGGKLGGCTGGGVTGGKLAATIHFANAANCDSLVAGKPTGAKGTETITWNNNKTSTVTLTLTAVKGQPTQTKATGVVTSGLFKGTKQSGTLNYTPLKGGCTTANLANASFKQVTPVTFS
jgi:hypothetical protein